MMPANLRAHRAPGQLCYAVSRMPLLDREASAQRRAAFVRAMSASPGPAVAILPSAPVFVRNNDVDHEYRQDSDFFYLTGFDEPGSLLLLDARDRKMTLVVRPRDREREIWDGYRAGVEGAKATYGADESFPAAEMDER